MAGALSLAGGAPAYAKNVDAPSDMPVSPLFGATDFSQQMLRFEEFDVRPVPAPGTTTPKALPLPLADASHPSVCVGSPDGAAMDAFLDGPLWPDPSEEANVGLPNPWASVIQPCVGLPVGFTGVAEGRPPGVNYAHQRWDEFPPAVAFQSALGQARPGTGRLDSHQSHGYAVGTEFGPGGLYYNTVGPISTLGGAILPQFDGSTAGINIALHPALPVQDPLALWTFGAGTLPPKLLRARYGQPILLRNYNALPIDVTANGGPGTLGFGEHTITTHEHNGHQPGESDGFAGAYFFPGEYYDYRWPMQMAGYDSINTSATDPRASTPCSPGETLMISNPLTGVPEPKLCNAATLTVNLPGDWHETMSTHWFHDHMIDRTSENVYKGNAAMMNYYSGIDRGKEGFLCNYADPNNVNLCFPSGTALDWGNRDYDVQLLVAEKAWNPTTGQLAMADQTLIEDGFLGDRMTVNWLYKPFFDVRARKYRFRILNGSVARFFKIAIVREFNDATSGDLPGPPGSNKSYSRVPFHMIANDGNIMEHAIPFPNAQSNDLPMQCIAERYDIIVDFAQFPVGTKLYMVNTVEHGTGRGPDAVIPLSQILNGTYVATPDLNPSCADHCWTNDPTIGKFLEFRVQPYSGTDLSMNPADYEVGKKTMIPLVKITQAELDNAIHRTMHFGRGGGQADDLRPTPWSVDVDGNGALNANLNRVYAAPETIGGGWEIWHILSGGGWGHPIHIHFEEGQYLQRWNAADPITGQPLDAHMPPLWEQGARKDMYRVSNLGIGALGLPDSSLNIDVVIRFREFAGTFVEHCHNTTHEDKAMLIRWDNEHPGQTVRIPTPIPDWEGVTYVSPSNPYTHLPSTEEGLPGELPFPGQATATNGTQGVFDDVNGGGLSQTEVQVWPTIKTGDVAFGATFVSPLQLSGDLNWDGNVNVLDIGILKSHFLFLGWWSGDLDENMGVNILDVGLLKPQFNLSTGIPLPNNNPIAP